MTAEQLPLDCPRPSIRHPDGNPWIYRPDPECPHHGRPFQARHATVTPIRRASR